MKTYLVTGGAGFIGSNFINYMLKKHLDIKLINLDKLTYAGNLENLKDAAKNPNYKFVQGDICDEELVGKLFKNNDIDIVVNFASESHVDRSIKNPQIFVKTNIQGTAVLLNAAKSAWETSEAFKDGVKFLQISTDEVYGSLGEKGHFSETTPLDPHSIYSSSKAGADLLVKAYYDTYKMPVCITRSSNNYGPFQFPEKLIPLTINNCINKKLIPVYGDGMNIRDWIYVQDNCMAIEMIINNGQMGQIYNIGGHNEKTNIHIIKIIIEYLHDNLNPKIDDNLITYVEDRKGHDRRYSVDTTKIEKEIGWHPETLFQNGIKMTIKWYLENKEWMKNVTGGEYQNYYEQMYRINSSIKGCP